MFLSRVKEIINKKKQARFLSYLGSMPHHRHKKDASNASSPLQPPFKVWTNEDSLQKHQDTRTAITAKMYKYMKEHPASPEWKQYGHHLINKEKAKNEKRAAKFHHALKQTKRAHDASKLQLFIGDENMPMGQHLVAPPVVLVERVVSVKTIRHGGYQKRRRSNYNRRTRRRRRQRQ